jgi:hypothetical protein
MTRRPEHAADCPGCLTGWVDGALLCPRCQAAVHATNAELYPMWMKARALSVNTPTKTEYIAMEAYRRGLIVGTALLVKRLAVKRLNLKPRRPRKP